MRLVVLVGGSGVGVISYETRGGGLACFLGAKKSMKGWVGHGGDIASERLHGFLSY